MEAVRRTTDRWFPSTSREEVLATRVSDLMEGLSVPVKVSGSEQLATSRPVSPVAESVLQVRSKGPAIEGPKPPPLAVKDILSASAPAGSSTVLIPSLDDLGSLARVVESISLRAVEIAFELKTKRFRQRGGWTDPRLNHAKMIDDIGLTAAVECSRYCRDIILSGRRTQPPQSDREQVFQEFLDRLSARGWLARPNAHSPPP